MRQMDLAEYEKFVSACDDGTLCDSKYCPYVAGETSRIGACEGDFCYEAWDNFIEKEWRDE